MLDRPFANPTWWLRLQVGVCVLAAGLVAVGAPGPVRPFVALSLVVAGMLALRRARLTPGEARTWLRLAQAAFVTVGALALAAVLLIGRADVPLQLVVPGLVTVAFPLIYTAVVQWNRGAQLIPHSTKVWLCVYSTLASLGVIDLVVMRTGSALADLSWGYRLAAELPLAAALVVVSSAATAPVTVGLTKDPRAWWLLTFCVALAAVVVPPMAGASAQGWAPVAFAIAALALGRASVAPARKAGEVTLDAAISAAGSFWCAAQAIVVLTVSGASGGTGIAVVAASVAGIGCAVLLLRDLRGVSELADIRRQSRTDDLTGAGNRRAVIERIDDLVGRQRPVTLAIVDLDDFGTVNDGLGHSGGDRLLAAVADRLTAVLPAGALLGRLGGDDFAVVTAEAPDDPTELGVRLAAALDGPFDIAGLRLHLTASVGLAVSTPAVRPLGVAADDPGGLPADILVGRAEAALRESRRHRGGPVVHDPERHESATGTLRLVEELREAVAGDELVLFLQPQIDVATGRVDGVEALVRWQHPTRGLLGPFAFVPVAEAHGLIGPLTERVVDLAITRLAAWRADGIELRMSVNLSATNLLDEALPERILARLLAHGVDPAALTLEITENVFVGDSDRVHRTVQALAALGCDLSIDDYGAGWSSLGYLRQLPVRELKLDRSFTADLLTDQRAGAIVGSTIDLAHQLGLRVVAEGVEDEATYRELAVRGCDLSQGYWHARPMPAGDIAGWLTARDTQPDGSGALVG